MRSIHAYHLRSTYSRGLAPQSMAACVIFLMHRQVRHARCLMTPAPCQTQQLLPGRCRHQIILMGKHFDDVELIVGIYDACKVPCRFVTLVWLLDDGTVGGGPEFSSKAVSTVVINGEVAIVRALQPQKRCCWCLVSHNCDVTALAFGDGCALIPRLTRSMARFDLPKLRAHTFNNTPRTSHPSLNVERPGHVAIVVVKACVPIKSCEGCPHGPSECTRHSGTSEIHRAYAYSSVDK